MKIINEFIYAWRNSVKKTVKRNGLSATIELEQPWRSQDPEEYPDGDVMMESYETYSFTLSPKGVKMSIRDEN